MPENTGKIQASTKFKRGRSGNPSGRPKGSKNKSTLLAEKIIENDLEAVCKKAVSEAKKGNIQAIKIILERVLPPKKDRPINIAIPDIKTSADILESINSLTQAVANGEITPSEGEAFARILDSNTRAFEIHDIEKRLKAIEENNFTK